MFEAPVRNYVRNTLSRDAIAHGESRAITETVCGTATNTAREYSGRQTGSAILATGKFRNATAAQYVPALLRRSMIGEDNECSIGSGETNPVG